MRETCKRSIKTVLMKELTLRFTISICQSIINLCLCNLRKKIISMCICIQCEWGSSSVQKLAVCLCLCQLCTWVCAWPVSLWNIQLLSAVQLWTCVCACVCMCSENITLIYTIKCQVCVHIYVLSECFVWECCSCAVILHLTDLKMLLLPSEGELQPFAFGHMSES